MPDQSFPAAGGDVAIPESLQRKIEAAFVEDTEVESRCQVQILAQRLQQVALTLIASFPEEYRNMKVKDFFSERQLPSEQAEAAKNEEHAKQMEAYVKQADDAAADGGADSGGAGGKRRVQAIPHISSIKDMTVSSRIWFVADFPTLFTPSSPPPLTSINFHRRSSGESCSGSSAATCRRWTRPRRATRPQNGENRRRRRRLKAAECRHWVPVVRDFLDAAVDFCIACPNSILRQPSGACLMVV